MKGHFLSLDEYIAWTEPARQDWKGGGGEIPQAIHPSEENISNVSVVMDSKIDLVKYYLTLN